MIDASFINPTLDFEEAVFSNEAEQAILGAALIQPDVMPKIRHLLEPHHFFRSQHFLIYRAIINLFDCGEPVDIITVSEKLNEWEELPRAGGRTYVNDLALMVLTTENVSFYAEMLLDLSQRREYINLTGKLRAETSGMPPQEAVAYSIMKLQALNENYSSEEETSTEQDVLEAVEFLRNKIKGVPSGNLMTGYEKLDAMLDGLAPEDLVIIGARPSMGKSGFACNLLYNIAVAQKKPAIMFSLEMSKQSVIARMLLSQTNNPKAIDQIEAASEDIGPSPFVIDPKECATLSYIRTKLYAFKAKYGPPAVVMVDHLHIMGSDRQRKGDNREELTEITKGLKAIAKEFKCPVVTLAQLNRGLEQRQDKRPTLSDLRESGSIEQDADKIIFIYRDSYYADPSDAVMVSDPTTEILVRKNRNGPKGTIMMRYYQNTQQFIEV